MAVENRADDETVPNDVAKDTASKSSKMTAESAINTVDADSITCNDTVNEAHTSVSATALGQQTDEINLYNEIAVIIGNGDNDNVEDEFVDIMGNGMGSLSDDMANKAHTGVSTSTIGQLIDEIDLYGELIEMMGNDVNDNDEEEFIDIMGDEAEYHPNDMTNIVHTGIDPYAELIDIMGIDHHEEEIVPAEDSSDYDTTGVFSTAHGPQISEVDLHNEIMDILGNDNINNEDEELIHNAEDMSENLSFPIMKSPCVRTCSKNVELWQEAITGVNQRFNSIHDLRETLRRYAIAHHFAFRYKKNDFERVIVRCKAEDCSWRIHAYNVPGTPFFTIKRMNPTHTCNGAASTTGYQATKGWVASIIKEKLKVSPEYMPKDIIKDIKEEYGIKITYFQAYRGKETAKEELVETFTEAYNQLPVFCEKILEANPGSFTAFAFYDDSSFRGLFVSFGASLHGFQQSCRPLICLDSLSLKNDTLLFATAADGDDKVFPVAFAIVDTETSANWHWFLCQLKNAIAGTSGHLTFVADTRNGLKESIPAVFPESFHAYCLRYLCPKLLSTVKVTISVDKHLLIREFYNAAYALTLEEFDGRLESIKMISHEAYTWILQSEISNWANFSILGARYNHMDSNFGAGFFSLTLDAQELPITQICEVIRCKTMDLFLARRADSDQWTTRLTPSMENQLHKQRLQISHNAVVSRITDTKFFVQGDSVEEVDFERWTCSCQGWQFTAIPCCHALKVINTLGANPYDYCSRYFSTENYRLTYADSLHPIPEIPRAHNSSQPSQASKASGKAKIPASQQAKCKPITKKAGKMNPHKREIKCSKCKGIGHNKKTCKE